MVKGLSADRGSLLLRVIGKERRHWLRMKEKADAQLTALDHAQTAFTAAPGRGSVTEREIRDAPQPG